jgi:hypothetical protein
VVVLWGGEEDGVGLGDGGVDGVDGGGLVVAVEILVIEWNVADVDQGELDRGLQMSGEELDEGGAEGGPAEASGDACDPNGGDGFMKRAPGAIL